MMMLLLPMIALLASSGPQAAPLSINTYPSGAVYTHPLDDQRGVRSLVLQNAAVINNAAAAVTVDAVTIELLRGGDVVDRRTLGPKELERAAKGGLALQASGQMALYGFQFGTVLGTPAAPLAGTARLEHGQGLLLTQQVFAFNGARDELRITTSGTADGKPVREVRSVPIVTAASKIAYRFPLSGNWFVGAGASLHTAHRWAVPEEYALDIFRLGEGGRSYQGRGSAGKDYFAYGAKVMAAAPGKVVAVVDSMGEDSTLFRLPNETGSAYIQRIIAQQDKVMAGGAARAAGNFVVLEHGNGEYSHYAHLRPGSIKVRPGALVEAGQMLAELGTSGMSTEPHLHFQVCNGPDPVACAGIPVKFSNITLPLADFPRSLQSGDFVEAN